VEQSRLNGVTEKSGEGANSRKIPQKINNLEMRVAYAFFFFQEREREMEIARETQKSAKAERDWLSLRTVP
jgi:hypothetical protein